MEDVAEASDDAELGLVGTPRVGEAWDSDGLSRRAIAALTRVMSDDAIETFDGKRAELLTQQSYSRHVYPYSYY